MCAELEIRIRNYSKFVLSIKTLLGQNSKIDQKIANGQLLFQALCMHVFMHVFVKA